MEIIFSLAGGYKEVMSIARKRAGIQEMFLEAEIGAWQYLIRYFSHFPKNLLATGINKPVTSVR